MATQNDIVKKLEEVITSLDNVSVSSGSESINVNKIGTDVRNVTYTLDSKEREPTIYVSGEETAEFKASPNGSSFYTLKSSGGGTNNDLSLKNDYYSVNTDFSDIKVSAKHLANASKNVIITSGDTIYVKDVEDGSRTKQIRVDYTIKNTGFIDNKLYVTSTFGGFRVYDRSKDYELVESLDSSNIKTGNTAINPPHADFLKINNDRYFIYTHENDGTNGKTYIYNIDTDTFAKEIGTTQDNVTGNIGIENHTANSDYTVVQDNNILRVFDNNNGFSQIGTIDDGVSNKPIPKISGTTNNYIAYDKNNLGFNVKVYNASDQTLYADFNRNSSLNDLVFSKDETKVYIATTSDNITEVNISDSTNITKTTVSNNATASYKDLSVSDNDNLITVTGSNYNIWNLNTYEKYSSSSVFGTITGTAKFDPAEANKFDIWLVS